MVFSKLQTQDDSREKGPRRPDAQRPSVQRPSILGILNVTPDSFSDGGRFAGLDGMVAHVARMVADGADAIDVGGESTRPGSDPVSVDEEKARVLPVLESLQGLGHRISIDTRRASIARLAAQRGATIVNDTSAMRDDPEMAGVVAEMDLEVVLMHRRGTPRTMQDRPHYGDVVAEVREFFAERVEFAETQGIPRERILLDPGFGFGKTVDHNYELASALSELRIEGTRLLVGASRKSFLARFDDRPAAERVEGGLAFAACAHDRGAEWVRVHDVLETRVFLDTLTHIASGEVR